MHLVNKYGILHVPTMLKSDKPVSDTNAAYWKIMPNLLSVLVCSMVDISLLSVVLCGMYDISWLFVIVCGMVDIS